MFVMVNDGSVLEKGEWSGSEQAVLVLRTFIFDVLASGVSVTLLQGCEFRNSKVRCAFAQELYVLMRYIQVLSFVFEQRFDPNARQRLSSVLWEVAVDAKASLGTQEAASSSQPAQGTKVANLDDGLEQLAKIFVSKNPQHVSRALFAVFVAHCILLPSIPISARAYRLPELDAELVSELSDNFLPNMFSIIPTLSPPTNRRWLDIDGRLFVSLVHFLMTGNHAIQAAIGAAAAARLDSILSSAGLTTDIEILRTKYKLGTAVTETDKDRPSSPRPLLAFNHPVFDEDLADVNVDADVESSDEEVSGTDHMHFGEGTVFKDTAHWHNHKRAILPKYLGGEDPRPTDPWQRKKKMRRDQIFMARMNKHAHTLTGALGVQLQRQVIPLAGRSAKQGKEVKRSAHAQVADEAPADARDKKGKGKKEKEPKLSSADKLRQKIKAEKETKSVDDLTTWWDEQLSKMTKMTLAERIAYTELLQRSAKAKEGWLAVEIRLWRLHLELSDWTSQPDEQQDSIHDRYSVSVMRLVKHLYEMSPVSPTIMRLLSSVLTTLGFDSGYVTSFESSFETDPSKVDKSDRKPRFDFIKLIKKSGSSVYKFLKIREHPIIWQLRLFGEFMDRSMDSASDRRVLFKPDAWQRTVLDCLDDNGHSVLVVGELDARPILSSLLIAISSSHECWQNLHLLLRNGEDSPRHGQRHPCLRRSNQGIGQPNCGRSLCAIQQELDFW
jgi:hypothetical protein